MAVSTNLYPTRTISNQKHLYNKGAVIPWTGPIYSNIPVLLRTGGVELLSDSPEVKISQYYSKYHYGIASEDMKSYSTVNTDKKYFLFDSSETSYVAGAIGSLNGSKTCASPYTAYLFYNSDKYLSYNDCVGVTFGNYTSSIEFAYQRGTSGANRIDVYLKSYGAAQYPSTNLGTYAALSPDSLMNYWKDGRLSLNTSINIDGVGGTGFFDFYCSFPGAAVSTVSKVLYFKTIAPADIKLTTAYTSVLICKYYGEMNGSYMVDLDNGLYMPGNITGTSGYGGGQCLWRYYSSVNTVNLTMNPVTAL